MPSIPPVSELIVPRENNRLYYIIIPLLMLVCCLRHIIRSNSLCFKSRLFIPDFFFPIYIFLYMFIHPDLDVLSCWLMCAPLCLCSHCYCYSHVIVCSHLHQVLFFAVTIYRVDGCAHPLLRKIVKKIVNGSWVQRVVE